MCTYSFSFYYAWSRVSELVSHLLVLPFGNHHSLQRWFLQGGGKAQMFDHTDMSPYELSPHKWDFILCDGIKLRLISLQATRHTQRVYVGGLPSMTNEQWVATFFSQAMAAVGANTAGPGTIECHWITFARQLLLLIHVVDVTAGCKIILAMYVLFRLFSLTFAKLFNMWLLGKWLVVTCTFFVVVLQRV